MKLFDRRLLALVLGAAVGIVVVFHDDSLVRAAPPDVPGQVQIVLRRSNHAGTPIDSTGGKRIRAHRSDLDTTGTGYEFAYSFADSFGFWKYDALPSAKYDFYIINGGLCSLLVTYQRIAIYNCEVCDSCIVDSLAFAPGVIPSWAYKNNSVGPNAINDTAAYNFGDAFIDSLLEIGAYTVPMTAGTAGQVMTTNGSNAATWDWPQGACGGYAEMKMSGTGELRFNRIYCALADSGDGVLALWAPRVGREFPVCTDVSSEMGIGGICVRDDTVYVRGGCNVASGWKEGDSLFYWELRKR